MTHTVSTLQRVRSVERVGRSTVLRLACGHDRSIGGHVTMGGTSAAEAFIHGYRCSDGKCGALR